MHAPNMEWYRSVTVIEFGKGQGAGLPKKMVDMQPSLTPFDSR
jgi:hypothetical protein